MNRLTIEKNKKYYITDEKNIEYDKDGYTGEAIWKLARFENVYDNIIKKQNELKIELDKLRSEGKTNSVKFKQLLANKMANSNILILFGTFDLE